MKSRSIKIKKAVTACLWCAALVYAVLLLNVIMLKNGLNPGINKLQLVPGDFVRDYINRAAPVGVLLLNVLGNIALFIPMGLLLPVLFKRVGAWGSVFICAAVSLGFELCQFVFALGICDVDDLLLNTLGGCIGTLLSLLISRPRGTMRRQLVSLALLAFYGLSGILAVYAYNPAMITVLI